jgi:hypothetical protein
MWCITAIPTILRCKWSRRREPLHDNRAFGAEIRDFQRKNAQKLRRFDAASDASLFALPLIQCRRALTYPKGRLF